MTDALLARLLATCSTVQLLLNNKHTYDCTSPAHHSIPPLPPSHQLHNIRALAVLATSAGHTLNAHIGSTLPKLLILASQPHSEEGEEESKEAAAAEAAASIALSVQVRGRGGGRLTRASRRKGKGRPCERRRGQRVIHHMELVTWRGLRRGKLVARCHCSCLPGLLCLCCDCLPPLLSPSWPVVRAPNPPCRRMVCTCSSPRCFMAWRTLPAAWGQHTSSSTSPHAGTRAKEEGRRVEWQETGGKVRCGSRVLAPHMEGGWRQEGCCRRHVASSQRPSYWEDCADTTLSHLYDPRFDPGAVLLALVLPCECSKVDFQEKVATLLDAVVALLGEEKPEVLQVRGGGEGGRGVLQLNREQDGRRSLKEGQCDATNVQQACSVG